MINRKNLMNEIRKIHSLFHSNINPLITLKQFALYKGYKLKFRLNKNLMEKFTQGYCGHKHWTKILKVEIIFPNKKEANLFFYGKESTENLEEFSKLNSYYKRRVKKIGSDDGKHYILTHGSIIRNNPYLIAGLSLAMLFDIPFIEAQHLMFKFSEEPGKFSADKEVQRILNKITYKKPKKVVEYKL